MLLSNHLSIINMPNMYFKLFLKLQFSQRSRVYTQNYKTERILSELCVTEISTLGVAVIPFA